MKTLLTGASAAALLSAAALAQLGGVTGQVRGQIDTTLDPQLEQTLDVRNDIEVRSDARIDTRTGLQLNADLVSDLDSHLRAYDRAEADARLDAELSANAAAYAPAPRTPRVSGRSAYGTAGTMTRAEADHAEIRVYSRDGYHIGNVERFRASGDGAIWIEPVNTEIRQGFALNPSDARFDAEASAVVTNMTRAQFDAMAMAG